MALEEAEGVQWNAVGRLFDRMWFKRLWVYQELQVAKRCRFIAGRYVLSLNQFRKAVEKLMGVWVGQVALNLDFLEKGQLERIGGFIMERLPGELGVLFHSTRYALCLDPRDRVYALLSLLISPYQREIRPDYNLQAEEVYKDLMVCHIRNSEMITLFLLVSGRKTFQPSWIPDLGNRDLPRYPFPIVFSASGNSRHEMVYSEAKGSLCVRGMHAGTIRRVGESVPITASISEILDIYRLWEPPDLLHTNTWTEDRFLMHS